MIKVNFNSSGTITNQEKIPKKFLKNKAVKFNKYHLNSKKDDFPGCEAGVKAFLIFSVILALCSSSSWSFDNWTSTEFVINFEFRIWEIKSASDEFKTEFEVDISLYEVSV